MSATGEVEIPAVEQPAEDVPAAEQSKPAETKPKEKKEKKPRTHKTASHPPYFQMIMEALMALNEKSGSSPYAIGKYMEKQHSAVLPANFRKILGLQLKNSTANGKLIKIKASYKLSEARKGEKVTAKSATAVADKKPKQAKPASATGKGSKRKSETEEKAVKPVKKAGLKKTRKSAPAKPKQPKSIKSPAAKKSRKATTS